MQGYQIFMSSYWEQMVGFIFNHTCLVEEKTEDWKMLVNKAQSEVNVDCGTS